MLISRKIVCSILLSLIASVQVIIAQTNIGESRVVIVSSLTKANYKITENTSDKVTAEFPSPLMIYNYFFRNDICYSYSGLIPSNEKPYYISEMKRNGWINKANYDNIEIFERNGFVLRVTTFPPISGYFKFQFDRK